MSSFVAPRGVRESLRARTHFRSDAWAGQTMGRARICVPVVVLITAFAVACPTASAQLAETSTFSVSAADGGLSSPQGVAVNQTTGDVYVADAGNYRVDEFSASGSFLLAFGEGADMTTGGDVCTAASDDTCGPGADSSEAGAFTDPALIAIDNTTGPSAGDVYVADTQADTVTKFGPGGNLLTSWSSGGQLNGAGTFQSIDGIAIDGGGDLLLINSSNQVYEYSQDGTAITNFATTRGMSPSGVAVGTNGDLFKVNGDGSVEELTSTGTDIGTVAGDTSDGVSATGIAIDPSSGDLYVDAGTQIAEYAFAGSGDVEQSQGPACPPTPETGCLATDYFGALTRGTGLAFDPSRTFPGAAGSGILYVADQSNDDVAVFVAPTPAAPQVATNSEQASSLTTNSVTLEASVNPEGEDTKYYFEYVDNADYAPDATDPYSAGETAPAAPGTDIGSTFNFLAANAPVSGLAQTTGYHFRIVAVNSLGTTYGPDQTFTTYPAPAQISGETVTNLTADSATLGAQINPGLADTTYYFECATAADYDPGSPDPYSAGFTEPAPPGSDIGDGTTPQAVTVNLTSLVASTTYHCRGVAINSEGTAYGSDETLTTATPAAPSVDGESVTSVTGASGAVSAQINPNFADTTYYFQYVAASSYDPSAANPYAAGGTVPVPPGSDLGSGDTDQTAAATLSGLSSGTSYDWRVVATNEVGTTFGQNQTLVTSVRIAGAFGAADIDLTSPSLIGLWLRQPNGTVSPNSLLTNAPGSGYTYFDTADGSDYTSEQAIVDGTPVINRAPDGSVTSVSIQFTPIPSPGATTGPEVETWDISVGPDGALDWTVSQHWTSPTDVAMAGTPALVLNRSTITTSTLWVDPADMEIDSSATCPGYFSSFYGFNDDTNCQIVRPSDTWAIYKLVSDAHEQSDIRLAVSGAGHLYRRGYSIAGGSEIGSVDAPTIAYARQSGQTDTSTLTISPSDKYDSGMQLDVKTPDPATTEELQDDYSSMLNGGAVTNEATFDFGNESQGLNYAGTSWAQGAAFAAGVEATQPMAGYPMTVTAALRGHISHILATVDTGGQAHFYYTPVEAIDGDLQTILAAHSYVVATGDLTAARQWIAPIERILEGFLDHRASNGLYDYSGGLEGYYDGCGVDGYVTYDEAFGYEALLDGADLEDALGNRAAAASYRTEASALKTAINSVLWDSTASGGPMYVDWLDSSGTHAFFMDNSQYPLIAFGIVPAARVAEMLNTADARMQELVTEDGYTRQATLSSLWDDGCAFGWPSYMDGGAFPLNTYWEVLARADAGDVNGEWGAYKLLQGFASLFARTDLIGGTWITQQGTMGGGEPYLSEDMVPPASLVNGILGITETWHGLEVDPHLPSGWPSAQAYVRYKGQLYHVTEYADGRSRVQPVGGGKAPPLQPVAAPAILASALSGGPSAAKLDSKEHQFVMRAAAVLRRYLMPASGSVQLSQLKMRGGLRSAFRALAAGTLRVTWYAVPLGTTGPRAPRIVAAGRWTFARSGVKAVTLRLSSHSLAELRDGRLEMVASGTFTARGEPPVSYTRDFSVRR